MGSVKGNFFEVGYSVFERILLKWAVTKSTSDLFFKIIYFGGSPSVFAHGSPHDFSHLHIFTSSHPHIFTSSHLHIFSSSHLLIFTSSHHILTSSYLHIVSSSHLHIFSSSHRLIFTSSHPHILTSSHPHIFTSSHLHIPSCPLALLPSSFSFFSISLLRRGAVPRRRHETQPFRTKRGSINSFARNEVRSPKTEVKLRF